MGAADVSFHFINIFKINILKEYRIHNIHIWQPDLKGQISEIGIKKTSAVCLHIFTCISCFL